MLLPVRVSNRSLSPAYRHWLLASAGLILLAGGVGAVWNRFASPRPTGHALTTLAAAQELPARNSPPAVPSMQLGAPPGPKPEAAPPAPRAAEPVPHELSPPAASAAPARKSTSSPRRPRSTAHRPAQALTEDLKTTL
jgi:hypothetical protein